MSALDQARAAIDRALAEGERVILALEGGAASGKTTLAAELAALYQAPVIHMDEFFLLPDMRNPERFAQPGGNIHSERFQAQAADPIRKNQPFSYEIFDCSAGAMAGKKQIGHEKLIIVEGVYSLHPLYRDIYTLRFFLKTDAETQDARLRARGEWLYERFQQAWLPMERAYFQAFQPEKCCDLILET